jgi:HSP20 family protein
MRDLLEAFLQDDRRLMATSRAAAGGQGLGQPMPVNVYQDPEAMIVEAMIPGAGPDDIDIQCAEGLLTIRARTSVDDHDYVHQEIQPTDWFRQLALPAELKYEQAEADASNGMLTIRIPKTRPRAPEKIHIQVSRKGSEAATIDAEPGEGYSEVKPKRRPTTE